MTQKDFTVEGRQFRTESDYARALHDKKIIDRLRNETDWNSRGELDRLKSELKAGKYRFLTLLGEDFAEEVQEALQRLPAASGRAGRKAAGKSTGQRKPQPKNGRKPQKKKPGDAAAASAEMDAFVKLELKRQEKRRKLTIALCSLVAVSCLGYFGVYSWYIYRTDQRNQQLIDLKNQTVETTPVPSVESGPQYTLDEAPEAREVLDEYKNLLNKNKKLIGWLKIDDTNIDFPVMQTSDNEYYLNHNLNQEYDRNGTIFMDKDCDVLKPSTNYIIYGHHMKSGKMFGKLDKYQDQKYCEEHKYIQFDTIYEKGTYEVMYVFRSRVYSEEEIVFKYYQFIDADGEQQFDSYMEEMASMSLFDTGVTAEYGDQLLTLSTCDYQEKNGRFVVVAKKIKE